MENLTAVQENRLRRLARKKGYRLSVKRASASSGEEWTISQMLFGIQCVVEFDELETALSELTL